MLAARVQVLGEFAQEDGTAELFTVAAVVGVDDTSADGDLMAAMRNGQCFRELILAVHQERIL
jgi:hypothetical protein